MISRIWHGWTTPEKADAYENLLNDVVFPGIAAKNVDGYMGIQLLRWERADEVEFTTIMWFDDLDAVKEFAGQENYEKAYVPDAARQLLTRFDAQAAHGTLKQALVYQNLKKD